MSSPLLQVVVDSAPTPISIGCWGVAAGDHFCGGVRGGPSTGAGLTDLLP